MLLLLMLINKTTTVASLSTVCLRTFCMYVYVLAVYIGKHTHPHTCAHVCVRALIEHVLLFALAITIAPRKLKHWFSMISPGVPYVLSQGHGENDVQRFGIYCNFSLQDASMYLSTCKGVRTSSVWQVSGQVGR